MHFTTIKNIITLLLIPVWLAGCTMAPKYERPAGPVPETWPPYAETISPLPPDLTLPPFPNADNGAEGDAPQSPVTRKNEAGSGAAAWSAGAVPAKSSAAAPSDQTANGGTPTSQPLPGEVASDDLPPPPATLPTWRDFFSDPTLRRLQETALANNRDLRSAVLSVERSRAMYQIQRSELFPTVTANASNSNQRYPTDLSPLGMEMISRQSGVSVGVTSFELDLFGRVRSLKDAALQQYFSSEATAYSAQISLLAEVAAAYLRLVADRNQLATSEAAYKSYSETYNLVERMFKDGVTSQLELNQAKSAMEAARVSVAQYQTAVMQDENILVLLLGAPIPSDLRLASGMDELKPLNELPAGLPSTLMERRPDIVAAEFNLKSANANIGAARANFFPRIGITASIGTASAEMSKLFSSGQGVWAFAPAVVLPVFEAGRNIANLKVSEVEREMAVANYEKAIQTAFREVADTLAQRSTIGDQLTAQLALVNSTTNTYELSLKRYKSGIDSFLNVLSAQRDMYTARQSYISALLLKEVNTLTMYKALGGGW